MWVRGRCLRASVRGLTTGRTHASVAAQIGDFLTHTVRHNNNGERTYVEAVQAEVESLKTDFINAKWATTLDTTPAVKGFRFSDWPPKAITAT
jgi:hypothetical protein